MTKFIIRRLLWTIPVLLLVILFTFLMMRQIKGNPFRKTERAVPAAIQANLDRKFHLKDPWYEQYANYVKGVFSFDLGPSLVLRNQSVNAWRELWAEQVKALSGTFRVITPDLRGFGESEFSEDVSTMNHMAQDIARLMDAILVASIDHGATPPSALAARTVASTGASLSASVAAGIMSINRHHGGAIEDCARKLKAIADRAAHESISMDEAATGTLAAMRETGERMPGFGHRYHTKDPRTARLFELAREAGVDGAHMKAARAVEKSFADAKKALPVNVDGAIGAILADLGMNPAAFNGLFMIARTPGLVAHVIEEQTREKPMRRIDPVNHGYDGPAPRSVSK